MNEKPSMLDGAFDLLSKVPYLRKLITTFWIIQTSFTGILFIAEISKACIEKISFRNGLTKDVILYLIFNPFFAWLFYNWNKREKSKKLKN